MWPVPAGREYTGPRDERYEAWQIAYGRAAEADHRETRIRAHLIPDHHTNPAVVKMRPATRARVKRSRPIATETNATISGYVK